MKEGEYTPGPWSVKTLDGYIDAVDVQDSRGMSVAWCAVSHQFGKDPANIGPRRITSNMNANREGKRFNPSLTHVRWN